MWRPVRKIGMPIEEAVCPVQQITNGAKLRGRVTHLREELHAEPRENLRCGRTIATFGCCAFFQVVEKDIDSLVLKVLHWVLEQTVVQFDATVPHTVVEKVVDASVGVLE